MPAAGAAFILNEMGGQSCFLPKVWVFDNAFYTAHPGNFQGIDGKFDIKLYVQEYKKGLAPKKNTVLEALNSYLNRYRQPFTHCSFLECLKQANFIKPVLCFSDLLEFRIFTEIFQT